jgi:hypothetical protein
MMAGLFLNMMSSALRRMQSGGQPGCEMADLHRSAAWPKPIMPNIWLAA